MADTVELTAVQWRRLLPWYNRAHHIPALPRQPTSSLAVSDSAAAEAEERYLRSDPSLVVVDDLFTGETLEALQMFAARATVWHDTKPGYVGACKCSRSLCVFFRSSKQRLHRLGLRMGDGAHGPGDHSHCTWGSNEGGSSPLLVPLPAVSWAWVPAWGSLERSAKGVAGRELTRITWQLRRREAAGRQVRRAWKGGGAAGAGSFLRSAELHRQPQPPPEPRDDHAHGRERWEDYGRAAAAVLKL